MDDDQLGTLAAMEKRRRSSAGRGADRSRHRRSDFSQGPELYQAQGGKFPDPILKLTWPYINAQHPALGDIAKS